MKLIRSAIAQILLYVPFMFGAIAVSAGVYVATSAVTSCAAMDKLTGSPEASDAVAEQAAGVASTGVTIATGNPALGAAAGALVTGVAAFFISKRKKPVA